MRSRPGPSGKDEWRRAEARARADRRAAKLAARAPPEPPAEPPPAELYVRAEAPAPACEPEPVVAPRLRGTQATHRQRIPKSAKVIVVDLDHPYRIPVAAERVAPPPGTTLNGHGPAEWQTPAPVTVTVAIAAKGDVVSYMHARHQIPRESFLAARDYEKLCVQASPRLPSSAGALDMPLVSGRRNMGDYQALENQKRAAARLAEVDESLRGRCGDMGLGLLQDVLKRGMTIEAAGEVRGETDRQEIRFLGSLFRRCLRELSIVLGFRNRAGQANHAGAVPRS